MPQFKGGPEGLNKILEGAYQSCVSGGGDERKCSKVAWAAVKNAGWTKEGDSWVKHSTVTYSLKEVEEICPGCVEKMKEAGLSEIVVPVDYFKESLHLDESGKFASDGKPPKDWWDKCVAQNKGKAEDVGAYCGFLWHNIVKEKGVEPAKVLSEDYTEEYKKLCEVRKTYATLNNVEIFRVGTWNGDSYTKDDLQRLVINFNKLKSEGRLEVPIKIGHSETQEYLKKEGIPAAGWVDKLKLVGGNLLADIRDVPKKIYDLVKKKAYKKTSAEIYPVYRTSDGDKFETVLRAVAFLGGDIPAVEGISDILGLYKEDRSQNFKVYVKEVNKFQFKIIPGKGLRERKSPVTAKVISGLVKKPSVQKQPLAGAAAGVPKISMPGVMKIEKRLASIKTKLSQYESLVVKRVSIPRFSVRIKN